MCMTQNTVVDTYMKNREKDNQRKDCPTCGSMLLSTGYCTNHECDYAGDITVGDILDEYQKE